MRNTPDFSNNQCANAKEFEQPHWKVIARGFETEAWFNDGQAKGTGGILIPEETRMPAGSYYYRFANSTSKRWAQLGGGWWVDFEAFKAIEDFAKKNGYRVKDAARLMLALPYSWTKVDLLVRAFLKFPLRAYTGLGKVAQGGPGEADKGTMWIPTQHIRVRQLYVPGLYVKGREEREQLYEKVFEQPPEIIELR